MRVESLVFRVGAVHLAVELRWVSSVLAIEEALGVDSLDPRPWLGIGEGEAPPEEARVGLLDLPGPPTVLYLGELVGARTLTAEEVLVVPGWLARHLPPILRPACVAGDEKVVWMLDLDTLRERVSP